MNSESIKFDGALSHDRDMDPADLYSDSQGAKSPSEDAMDNLYPALIQCFAVILCGYVAGRLKLISDNEVRGLNTFVGTFSLPCLIFLSIAELDLSSVNWIFLLAVLIAKSIVFFAVIILTLLVTRPVNLGKAGLHAIFCTQSNDFAIGYPIVVALYQKTHAEFASYLYLMAPISLVMLNPIAFILMEVEKMQRAPLRLQNGQATSTTAIIATNGTNSNTSSMESANPPMTPPNPIKMVYSVIRNVVLNPIVAMTILGIGGNLIFKHQLPVLLRPILQVLGSAFSGTALFTLGIRMVDKVHKLKGDGLVVPGILIIVKLLVLPLLTRETVSILHSGANETETVDLSTYGFLYGTFPSAPGVFVFATQYNIEVDLIASSMVVCTFLSAPLMYISAKMISLTKLNPAEYLPELDTFSFDVSIANLIACIWLIFVLLLTKKYSRVPHRITLCLILSQMMSSIGMIMWYNSADTQSTMFAIEFLIYTTGVYSARIWTTFLSVTLLFLQCRSLCFVLKLQPFFIICGWGIPLVISMLLLVFDRQNATPFEKQNPNFQYGAVQAAIAVFILTLCFIITVGCLILQQRYRKRYEQYLSLIHDISSADTNGLTNMTDTEDESDQSRRQERRSLPTINEVENRQIPDIEDLLENIAPTSILSNLVPRANDVLNPDPEMCPNRFRCRRDNCQSTIKNYQDQQHRSQHHVIARNNHTTTVGSSTSETFLNRTSSCGGGSVTHPQPGNEPEAQILKHIVLCILLLASMFTGLAVSVWTLVMEKISGIYVELAFLDATLNCGQGLIVFAIFGTHFKDLRPIMKVLKRIYYWANTFIIEPDDELSFETKFICDQFVMHHVRNCEQAISANKRHMLKTYKRAFTGAQLVDWLLDVSLAQERVEAAHYAQHLLMGKVIKHVDGRRQFRDSSLLYTFEH